MVFKIERKLLEDSNGIVFFEVIYVFLSRKKGMIDMDIEKINRYIFEDDIFFLFFILENIFKIICCLDEEYFIDNIMYWILEVFLINFYFFKNDFLFGLVFW